MKRNEKIFFERSGKIGWIVAERACYRLQRQVGLHIIIIDEEKNLFGKSRLPVLLCEKVQAVIIEDFSKQQVRPTQEYRVAIGLNIAIGSASFLL